MLKPCIYAVGLLQFVSFFFTVPVAGRDLDKVVFCSINQKAHRLYRVSEAVLAKAFQRLGVDFEMTALPPNRIARELNLGKIDGDSHRIHSYNRDNQYPNLIRVEEPVQTVGQSVFTRREDIRVDGWESLVGYKILYIIGIKVIENGLDQAGFTQKNRIGVYDIDRAFELLNLGRGDIVVVSPSTGRNSLKKLGLTGSGIRMLSPPLITIDLYPYMNKQHAGLATRLAQELRSMKKSGEYDRIVNSIPD